MMVGAPHDQPYPARSTGEWLCADEHQNGVWHTHLGNDGKRTISD